ncbi:MAG: tetratricopeptide repeat protein, partial [Firmicutes bacterium]|nr:tetratricopeptide repeat protein [Bacillota bacterium]
GEKSLLLADTLSNWGVACSMKKMTNEAYSLHKRALDIRKEGLDENHEDLIMSLYNMGSACEDNKRYDKALQYYEEAKAKAENQEKISRSDYGDMLMGCGRINEKKGVYIKALEYYKDALEIIESEEEEKSIYHLSTLLDVAAMCDTAKLYEESVKIYNKAVAMRRKMLDETHLDFITNLNCLAGVYKKMGNGEKAIKVHMETLGLIKKLLGEDHSFYAECLANMASDCAESKNYYAAEEYYKEALSRKKKDSEKDATGYTFMLAAYASVLLKQDKFDEAEEMLEEMLSIRKEKYGTDSVIYAAGLIEIAKFYAKKNMRSKAVNYYREAIEIKVNEGKDKDITLADMYASLADMMAEMGNTDYAIKYSEENLIIRRKIYGSTHPVYAEGLFRNGKVRHTLKMYKNANGFLEDALKIQKECLGEKHKETLETMGYLADNNIYLAKELFDKKEAQKAVKCYETAEKLYKKAGKKTSDMIKGEFAFLYAYVGETEKAEKMLEDAEKYVVEKYGENSIEYAEVLKNNGKFNVRFTSFDKGEKLLFKAMEVLYAVGGENGAWQGEISLFLGESCLERGRCQKAESYFKTALPLSEGVGYAKTLSGLGTCLIKLGNTEKGMEKLLSAKKYMEEYEGADSNCYSQTVMLLGNLCEKQGDVESACRYYNLSVSKRRMNGDRGGNYQKDLVKLSSLQKKLGMKEDAASSLKEAAELAENENEKAKLYVRCAKLNGELKKYDFAVSLLQKAENICEKAFGYASDERAAVVYDEAIMSIKAGKTEEAVLYFEMLKDILKDNSESKFNNEKYFEKYKKIIEKT